ncbi:MAG: adenosylcobinamide amidohydrolase [Desulfobacterales bacterium]
MFFFLLGNVRPVFSWPVSFQDANNRRITIEKKPQRAVSLVPAVTELIFAIGAGDSVQGVTYHDTYPPEAVHKPCVGGFFSPSPDLIRAQNPELIFVSDLHKEVTAVFKDQPVHLVRVSLNSLPDLSKTIALLGQIFQQEEKAAQLSAAIDAQLKHTAQKTAHIAPAERKRVIRLMGRDQVMTPGDDSFQNEMIRLAGGIPPALGKSGSIVPVTLAEWQKFNPQVIYGCGDDRKTAESILNQPGWKDVDAVKNGKIFYWPCDLTCRLSSRTAYFVSWLSARIYREAFEKSPRIVQDRLLGSKAVSIDLPYVKSAEIAESSLYDFVHKTLLITFGKAMSVSSTLEGFRENILCAGNSYSPPQVWDLNHRIGLDVSRRKLLESLKKDAEDTSLLFTGADMDNLSVQKQSFQEMTVYALVTAGVESNALRMSQDTGAYYEPGTINMILMSNRKLTPRAMNRAIISATEAKTAALWDMDIRSSQTPLNNPATGTGTDNIIVVQGDGAVIDNAGGHCKLGELIAKAVYAGVQEAVFRQNGLVQKRSVFQRLKERNISLHGMAAACECGMEKGNISADLEKLLLLPYYAGFMETALSLSDAYERGQVEDTAAFQAWCDRISEEIAGKAIEKKQEFSLAEPLPHVLEMAFKALLNGIAAQNEE